MAGPKLFLIFSLLAARIGAYDQLGSDQIAALHDSGGWEYISLDDSQDGFPTQHVCFDGEPHPDTCRGTLTFSSDNSFVQNVSVHHQSVLRHGTYQLNGDQLALFDEFGTRDGPYTVAIDMNTKFMTMEMPQVKIKLQLTKEYKRLQEEKRRRKNKQSS